MNVEIKATKSNKEKGGQSESKKHGMIPRTRALRVGEVYFPTKTMISRSNYERILRMLDRSKYTRIFQDTNKELLQIIKKLNPSFTHAELKKELTKYEEFEQPQEMAIELIKEVENIKKLIPIKNQEIEDINKHAFKQIKQLDEEHEIKVKKLKREIKKLNEDYVLKTKEIKKSANEKIKDIKKDVYELQAEVKKLKTRAEKYKNIKRNV